MLLLCSDCIQGTYADERLFQRKRQRLGRGEGHAHTIKGPRSGGNSNGIEVLHGEITFSHETLNAVQQLYAVVVANQPCIFTAQAIF